MRRCNKRRRRTDGGSEMHIRSMQQGRSTLIRLLAICFLTPFLFSGCDRLHVIRRSASMERLPRTDCIAEVLATGEYVESIQIFDNSTADQVDFLASIVFSIEGDHSSMFLAITGPTTGPWSFLQRWDRETQHPSDRFVAGIIGMMSGFEQLIESDCGGDNLTQLVEQVCVRVDCAVQ